jgi:hypothetical protein
MRSLREACVALLPRLLTAAAEVWFDKLTMRDLGYRRVGRPPRPRRPGATLLGCGYNAREFAPAAARGGSGQNALTRLL